jgi:hypothetical protein
MALDDPGATSPRHGQNAEPPHPDPARLVADERLSCGRLISHAWEQARTPHHLDPHTANCPYCRQAGEGLAALDRSTRILRADRPNARTVAERVIRAVRAERRLGRMLPLDDPARDMRIAEIPTAKILRRAADRVPGIRAASCRLTPDDTGTTVAITMTLAATLDEPLPGRAAQVRRAVLHAARQQLGLAVSSIDLTIANVLEPVKPSAATDLTLNVGSGQRR